MDPRPAPLHTYREGMTAQFALIFCAGSPPLIVGGIAAALTSDMLRPHADEDMWPVLWGVWALFFALTALFIWLMRGRKRRSHVYTDGVGLEHRGKLRFIPFDSMATLKNAITKGKVRGRPRLFVQCDAQLHSGEVVPFVRHHAGVYDKNLLAFMDALRDAHAAWQERDPAAQ